MSSPDLLEVGRIDKPHGVGGDVLVTLTTNRHERVAVGSVLHSDHGPLTVTASRPHQARWIVHFAGADGREAAEALRATTLRAEPIDDPDELWVHDLIGCAVVDADGIERGLVEAVEEHPANDVLLLDSGHIVPVRFVVGHPDAGVVRVETPSGLFDVAEDR